MSKKRLFFALWPDDEVRQQIATAGSRVREIGGEKAVPPENFHITLAFLGSVSASSMADIVATAATVRFLPCEVVLERTGYWPRSRVAWLAPADCPLVLSALVDDLWNKLTGLGFQQEASQFLPHVTLCRDVDGGLGLRLPEPIRWSVSSFGLAESRPSASGPVYTVLEQFTAGI